MLEDEIKRRLARGWRLLSVREFSAEFKRLGYKLDRSMDCRSVARWISGPDAGTSYPCCSTDATEIATGKSYAHYQGTRDANFRRMMQLRSEIFAVSRGAILEI